MTKIIKKKLNIKGMHCTSCAMNIDFDLEDLEGIIKSHTNYVKQETEIEYNENKVKFEDIILRIQKIGYKVQLVN